MAVCCFVYQWGGVSAGQGVHNMSVEYSICDEATEFTATETASVSFALTASAQQIKQAIGTAVRDHALATFGLTIPSNEVIMPEISKV